MTVKIWNYGKVVSESRNLRCIRDYGKRADFSKRPMVTEVTIIQHERPADGRLYWDAALQVKWDDGADVLTPFADYNVCRRWVLARRSWAGATVKLVLANGSTLTSELGTLDAKELLS